MKNINTWLITIIGLSALCLGLFFSPRSSHPPELLAQHLHKKVTLVNFWATWCPPCLKEIPDLIKLHAEFKDRNFSVIGVAIDSQEKVYAFEQKMNINYPSLIADRTGYSLMEYYGSRHGALPYTIVLNQKGDILYQHHKGIINYENAKEIIEPLL